MRKSLLALGMTFAVSFAMFGANTVANDVALIQHQMKVSLENSPMVRSGKVLLRDNGNSGVSYLQQSCSDPVEAWLKGVGPMTQEVSRALAGKAVMQIPDIPESLLQQRARRAESEEGVMVLPQVIIHSLTNPDLFYLVAGTVIISGSTKESPVTFAFAYASNEAVEASWEVPEGTYTARMTSYIYDLAEGKIYGVGLAAATATITAENPTIEIYCDDCLANCVTLKAELPDGTIYPDYDPENPDKPFGNTNLSVYVPGLTVDMMSMIGSGSAKFFCPDGDYGVRLTCTFEIDTDEHYTALDYCNGPFSGEIERVVSADCYRDYTGKFNLTETEKNGEYGGIASKVYAYTNGSYLGSGFARYLEGQHPEESTVMLAMDPNMPAWDEGGLTPGVITGVVTSFDLETYAAVIKFSGFPYSADGVNYSLPENIDFCPTLYPRICWANAPESYFLTALYGTGRVSLRLSSKDQSTIENIRGSYNLFGFYNERIENPNTWDFFKTLKVNGVEKTREDIIGTQFSNGNTYEFTFCYEDIDVYGHKAPNEMTVCFNANGEDEEAPRITWMTLRDGEGNVNNIVKPGEGNIYVGAFDSNSDYEVKVEVSRQYSDEWTEVSGILLGSDPNTIGDYCAFSLADANIADNNWYKVRVTATDSYGNFTSDLLNYCFLASSTGDVNNLDFTGELYAVGSMTDDAIDKNFKFTQKDGVFTLTKASMEGEFKITTVDAEGNPDWTAVDFGGGFNLENGSYSLVWQGEPLNIAMTDVTLSITYDLDTNSCILSVEGTQMEKGGQNPVLSTEGAVQELTEISISWPDFAAVEIAEFDAQLIPQAAETRANAIPLTAEVVAGAEIPTVVLTPTTEVADGKYQLVVKAGSFTLTDAEGNKVASEVITASYDVVSRVEGLAGDEGEVVWFNLQGVRVDNPGEGIFIRVANGKAQKVVTKK